MNVLLDTSSIINLSNAGLLELFCEWPRCRFSITPWVMRECDENCATVLTVARGNGQIDFVDDDNLNSDQFLDLIAQHQLGNGETECIAVAAGTDFVICSDDRKARVVAAQILGPDQVVGTIRLLRWCVEDGLFKCTEAFDHFRKMRALGGFLPEMQQQYFCVDAN